MAVSLKVGAKAPGFDLVAEDGARVTLDEYAGRRLVLYFYPKDDTPGCTVEAREFSAALEQFRALGAEVVGVSRDSTKRHRAFCEKHALTIRLLTDEDAAVHRAYGAWGEKTMYGRTTEGCIRSTFLIDPDGTVRALWSPVKVAGHVPAVLDAVRAAAKG